MSQQLSMTPVLDDPLPLPTMPGILETVIGTDGRGWVMTDNLPREKATALLKARFGPGFWFRDMYFARRGARILVTDRSVASDLPPGFAAVPDLDDATETRLVSWALAQLDRIEADLSAAASARDADALEKVKRALEHVLGGLFWRDPDLPPGPRPSGPWAAISARLTYGVRRPEEPAEVIRTCLAETRALIHDQHGGEFDPGISAPVWYTERQAQVFDDHRDFPRTAGTVLKQILERLNRRNLVEVGAGTGRVALALQQAGVEIPMRLSDNAPAMLAHLRARFPDSRVEVCRGRMDDLPALAQGADTIIEHEVFFLHPNPQRLARSLAGFLNEQGVLIRLERQSTPDPELTLLSDRFDRQIVMEMGSPVGFVGRDTFDTIDLALARLGFETRGVPVVRYDRQIARDEVLTARRARAFPYLEPVPDTGLERAIQAARADEGPDRFVLKERYDIRVTAKPDLLARLTRAQVLQKGDNI
jgi:SAM-dependent methyltransferase